MKYSLEKILLLLEETEDSYDVNISIYYYNPSQMSRAVRGLAQLIFPFEDKGKFS